MGYKDEIIAEFDELTRVLHLTAKRPLHVKTMAELNELCSTVYSTLGSLCSSDRCYMIVDLSKFIIDIELSKAYMQKIGRIYNDFIYPNGLVRYGYEITRVTIKIAYTENPTEDPHLFRSKEQAYNYINGLIRQRTTANQNSCP